MLNTQQTELETELGVLKPNLPTDIIPPKIP